MATRLALLGAAAAGVAAQTAQVTVLTSNVTNPAVSRRWMGCHTDPGFTHETRGWSSNMIYGTQFQGFAWTYLQGAGAAGTFTQDTFTAWNGQPAASLAAYSGNAGELNAALSNRGIGNEGFSLQGGQVYEGTAWVWTRSNVTLFVGLRDFTTGTVLASQLFPLGTNGPAWGSTWQNLSFSLTPAASTPCVSIAPNSDPTIQCEGLPTPAHICVRCGGEFVIGIVGVGSIALGHVELHVGPWGRVGNLPVLASAGQLMQQMGITTIRQGGSVSQSMAWKRWRGPTWQRAAMGTVWGDNLIENWGPFELIDFANAVGIEPIVTLAYDINSATDWADLVEYCWGDGTTTYGSLRIVDDGHPAPYNITVFELGNEQYNPAWVDQVAAMESRAAQVGAPPLRYMFPLNTGLDAAGAGRALTLGLPVDRIMPDLHVGAGGAVEAAAALFAAPPVPGFNQGAINCETNAATHDMTRALAEAADLIDFFTADVAVTSRIYARTASFCFERSGHFDNFDQGIAFFLPNMTWLQPPGWVHAMISQTWAEVTLQSTLSGGGDALAVAAQTTADGASVVVRAVNSGNSSQVLAVSLTGGAFQFAGAGQSWTLSGPQFGENTPGAPVAISPVQATAYISSPTAANIALPPFSFVVAKYPRS